MVTYDPVTQKTEYIGEDLSSLGNAKWCGGVEGDDGVVYSVPNVLRQRSAATFCGNVLRIDTKATDTTDSTNNSTDNDKNKPVTAIGRLWVGHFSKVVIYLCLKKKISYTVIELRLTTKTSF